MAHKQGRPPKERDADKDRALADDYSSGRPIKDILMCHNVGVAELYRALDATGTRRRGARDHQENDNAR